MDWERASIEAAAVYLREMIDAGAEDYRTRTVYEGLLDVLDPRRQATRVQRTSAADAATEFRHARERRARLDRRGHTDRRLINFGPAAAGERRVIPYRRTDAGRRSH